MKPYLIIYENGNGYRCGCCRRTWTAIETMEFENDEEAKEYKETYNKNNDADKDSEIENIYALENINPIN